ncbi:ImmA/IrrE family metallo-endopeptidase [Caloramator quimbayensis]|uniref:ImmA/IrrE family metallo-endopeptidase n=1 Tax=Caloramator quimbayensis TaxID=1147123 RepID=UPI0015C4B62B|nr:ImmA/IrrE family metallo-endopeptidase [Caloramator quimbayensis]
MPQHVRRERSIQTAQRILLENNISSLPVDIKSLFKKYGYFLVDYSTAEKYCSKNDPLKFKNAEDCLAATYLMNNKYLTVYKENIRPYGRLVWTLSHEFGHIVLGHLEDFDETDVRRTLTDNQYEILEKEADAFAAELLAPIALLKNIKGLNKEMIQSMCSVSEEASIYILENIKKFGNMEVYTRVEYAFLESFFDFIMQTCFKINTDYNF